MPISDTGMSFYQSREFKQWAADYISFRDNPPHPMIDEN